MTERNQAEEIFLAAHDALEAAREHLRDPHTPSELWEQISSALYGVRGRSNDYVSAADILPTLRTIEVIADAEWRFPGAHPHRELAYRQLKELIAKLDPSPDHRG